MIPFLIPFWHVQEFDWSEKLGVVRVLDCRVSVGSYNENGVQYVKKQRILGLYSQGLKAPTIVEILHEEEQLHCTWRGVATFLKKSEETGSLSRRSGSGGPTKITAEIKEIVEQQMQRGDETTAVQLYHLCNNCGYSISLRSILRCRTSPGWTFRGSAYCQLIWDANKVKWPAWAHEHVGETFDDVIFTRWNLHPTRSPSSILM